DDPRRRAGGRRARRHVSVPRLRADSVPLARGRMGKGRGEVVKGSPPMARRTVPRRSLLFTAVAVALAIVLFVILERVQNAPLPQFAVIEATRDIQINEPITGSLLEVVRVPRGAPLGPAPARAGDLPILEHSTARAPI